MVWFWCSMEKEANYVIDIYERIEVFPIWTGESSVPGIVAVKASFSRDSGIIIWQ